MTQKTMVIDLDRCIGCFACEVACKQENNVALGVHYNKVLSIGPMGKFPEIKQYFLPSICQGCKDAPCVKVCPTGACHHDPATGIVTMNTDRCVGCKYCIAACPYNARYINEETKVADNCDFCLHSKKLDQGELPGCVARCRFHALAFGDLNDPKSYVSLLLKARDTVRIRPWLGTEPTLRYIPVVKTGV